MVFFWSNEGNEPIHVHIAKGQPAANPYAIIRGLADLFIVRSKHRINEKIAEEKLY